MTKVYAIARTHMLLDPPNFQAVGTSSIDAKGKKTLVVEGYPTLNQGKSALCEQSGVALSDLIHGDDAYFAESPDGYLYILTGMEGTPQAPGSETKH